MTEKPSRPSPSTSWAYFRPSLVSRYLKQKKISFLPRLLDHICVLSPLIPPLPLWKCVDLDRIFVDLRKCVFSFPFPFPFPFYVDIHPGAHRLLASYECLQHVPDVAAVTLCDLDVCVQWNIKKKERKSIFHKTSTVVLVACYCRFLKSTKTTQGYKYEVNLSRNNNTQPVTKKTAGTSHTSCR
mgnify:CR=1 FL=1